MATTAEFVLPELGDGLYTFSEAARILRRGSGSLTTRQLHYWMTTGLSPSSYEIDGTSLLSFDDLVSLEIVRRFRTQGTSLQRVRHFERVLRARHGHERPFAWRAFFTDGAELWGQTYDDDRTLATQLTGRDSGSAVWLDAIKTFASEITYDRQQHAASWTLSKYVQVDPSIQFGAPAVSGTRVTVDTIAANLRVASVKQVAAWYGLKPKEVRGVQEYLAVT